MKFATYLKKRRRELSLRQPDLADLLGVSISSVKKWETGSLPKDLTIRGIKRVLEDAKPKIES